MTGEYLSIEDAEKIKKYDELVRELEQTKSQKDYWKQEHSSLAIKYKNKKKECNVLKAELLELNMKFNERRQ